MMYSESDLVPLSALQHFMFCPRQCALIHLEQIWVENRFTAEGRLMHDKVDQTGSERRRDVKRVFALPIRSLRLGLSGKADVVEFHRQEEGAWRPYPVEHKRGRRKEEDWDRVQLCAQALCLEEMLGVAVAEGALFYGKEKRREVVEIGDELRRETEETAAAVHSLFAADRTPSPEYGPKCENCSLLEVCIPKELVRTGGSISRYLAAVSREP